MTGPELPSYAFGRFVYDAPQAKLLLAGREVPLTARELHLLVIFLDRPAQWLDEEWIARGLWPKAVPPTGELDRLVRSLTAALDEGADGVATIQVVKRRGYRLLIPVRPLTAAAAKTPPGGSSTKPLPLLVPAPESQGSGEHGGSEKSGAILASASSGGQAGGAGTVGIGAVTLPAGRSAHKALVSPGQIAAVVLVVAAAALALFWWMVSSTGEGASAANRGPAAPDAAAMRAAAAAELEKGLAAAPGLDLASRRAAISHFEAALQLDAGPRNQAAAHAALAGVLVLENEMESARLEAQAALASNIALGEGAKLADPLAALAFTQLFLARDPVAAKASAERALGLDALHVGARRALVWVCAIEGRFDDALRELEPARLPGQFDPEVATDEAWIRYFSGRPIEARQLLTAIVRREPLFRRAHVALAAIHLAERRLAAAAVELELLDALNGGARRDDERVRRLTASDWVPPDASESARLLEERAAGAKPRPGTGGGVEIETARIYAQFGRTEEALAALSRALERRESGATLARIDPAFASLRNSPAFRKLVDNAGIPALVKPTPSR